jgi:hypothetical protein
MTPDLQIPLRFSTHRGLATRRDAEPVTGGVPFPRGAVRDLTACSAITSDGAVLPAQARVMDRWGDGSVRWALVDLQVPCAAGATHGELTLRTEPASSKHAHRVTRRDGHVTVDTGTAAFELSTTAPLGLEHVRSGDLALAASDTALRVQSGDGTAFDVTWRALHVEDEGPLRTTIALHGSAATPGRDRLELILRFDFHAGLSTIRVRLTVRNPRRAEHPGGIWELGDAGSVLLTELTLAVSLSGGTSGRVVTSIAPDAPDEHAGRFELLQESSGGDNWRSPNHRNRTGEVPMQHRGYRGSIDGRPFSGLRANPIVLVEHTSGTIGVAVPEFWENFPRGLSATPASLTVSFVPPDTAAQELQGGEQKTHECYLLFGRDTVTARPLEWCRSRLVLHATPGWYEQTQAVPHLVSAVKEDSRYRILVDAAIDGGDSFVHKRERADEYGWRHFGDIYGDHEAVFHQGSAPLMSHYNNQYDPVGGFLYQFMRTGDLRWHDHFRQLAAHVVDIDIYHTTEDKAAYNQGLFWHTYHYVDAGLATHRSYPRGTVGGGPSSEQNYPTGLMLHHFVTGDAASREAALGLAQFVIAMDDGTRTPFRFVDRGYTGVASASRSPDYHGPGRGSGNSLNALVDGHRLSRDRTFLDKAEQIIRRCTHPRQDIDRLQLLDPENRWFYTMYLQSLGKYLEWKIELGELDAMYAYGRAVLLHFARWMAAYERPYLDQPELLEYPTETWAAQDIRKSEIFDVAARFTSGEERERFLERAEFFFDYCVRTLSEMPTRTLARPVVLLVSHGLRRGFTHAHGILDAPAPIDTWEDKWPAVTQFVPQKARARRRVVQIAAAGAALGILGLAALMF